jgi:glutathione S-transferase
MQQPVIFYTNPMSRGQIARWALEEVGIAYETQVIEYGEQMKAQAYRAINPMGKVPALQHNGQIITETAAICAYLAHSYPQAALGPMAEESAAYYRWFFFAAGPLEQAITNKAMQFNPSAEQGRMAGYGSFELTIDVLDAWLQAHDYACGARFTMVDVYLGSQIIWGTQFGTLPNKPSFAAYASRLRERQSYVRAKEIDNSLIEKQKSQLS